MTITQTVEIPANRRITLEVPRETPIGRASMEYKIIPFVNKIANPKTNQTEVEKIRQLLQKEMALNGTSSVINSSGDGWEAYVKERYAKP